MINFLIKVPLEVENGTPLSSLFIEKPQSLKEHKGLNFSLLTWGDAMLNAQTLPLLEEVTFPITVLKNVKGHFYYILKNNISKQLYFGSALFSILPVYYAFSNGEIVISNRVPVFRDYMSVTINPRFILENILFNYPLFNITSYNEVKLLGANTVLSVANKKFAEETVLNIEELFNKNPVSQKKSLNNIIETFLATAEQYFPDKPFNIALTGGFDGRTLIATAKKVNKPFYTYTFGTYNSGDVRIANKIAQEEGFSHNFIDLNVEYVENSSLKFGKQFIEGSNGIGSFSRAHYSYAIDVLKDKSDTFITGNFGSELFRALHIAGVVVSPNLYHIFNAKNYSEAISNIDQSPEWDWLNRDALKVYKQELYEDLKNLPSFSPNYKHLTKNQQFYKLTFDEIFRKYFGAEMVNQFQYIKNRTPFLDYQFIKVLLNSKFAGVHSDFFTHNPLKRRKGQVVYAHILKQTYNNLYNAMLDKGYRPSDILTLSGKLRLVPAFILKQLRKEKLVNQDPYAVKKAFDFNQSFWCNQKIDENLFNKKNILKGQGGRDGYYIALSQIYWNNFIK